MVLLQISVFALLPVMANRSRRTPRHMAEKPKPRASVARLNLIVGLDTSARVDEARAALKRKGIFVSASAIYEVAALELLKRGDIAEVLRRHGAKARRG